MTVIRPSGSWVTMWSRLAEAVSEALGSIASGRSPLHALCTSLRRTSTCARRSTSFPHRPYGQSIANYHWRHTPWATRDSTASSKVNRGTQIADAGQGRPEEMPCLQVLCNGIQNELDLLLGGLRPSCYLRAAVCISCRHTPQH